MRWTIRSAGQTLAVILSFVAIVPAWGGVSFDWVTVGNPGNAADPLTSVGSVGYTYYISKYEVTNTQYVQFLNAADPTGANTHNLYNSFMSSYPGVVWYTGGVDYNSAASVGAKYSVKPGHGNLPATWITWNDAARFSNWMQNGQGSGSTESGVYDMSKSTDGIVRAANATIFIPSENEWYKAAYYDPTKNGTGGYWKYPTRSDTEPNSTLPPGSASVINNAGNFFRDDEIANGYNGGYALTNSNTADNSLVYLTDVGAYSGSPSYYGTFDQGGNAYEWDEASYSGGYRQLRGGSWYIDSYYLQSANFNLANMDDNDGKYGFRVASLVPEPHANGIAALLLVGLARRKTRSSCY